MAFLKLAFILDSLHSAAVLDPYSDQYRLMPGSNVKKVTVHDIRPLLLHQTSQETGGRHVSAIVALKRHRKKLSAEKNATVDDESTVDESTVDETVDESTVDDETN